MIFVEMGKVYEQEGVMKDAQDYIGRAIGLLTDIKSEKFDLIADLYQTMSGYQEKEKDEEGYLNSLKSIKEIYLRLYGASDQKTMKVQRQLALGLLKSNQHDEARLELLDLEEIENAVFGDESIQVAKTQKIIGTLLVILQDTSEALKYLNRAMKIFSVNGAKNMVAEVKAKINQVKGIRERGEHQH